MIPEMGGGGGGVGYKTGWGTVYTHTKKKGGGGKRFSHDEERVWRGGGVEVVLMR